MNRHHFLKGLHELVRPRTYFEIGVDVGNGLRLSRARSIGVDPSFALTREIRCDLHLVRTTSDEFFARRHPLAHFDQPLIDLAFIDGMHLAEYALRDFINVERYTHPASVILIDDMLPRSHNEASRDREAAGLHMRAWAGDVYKVSQALREHRRELVVLEVDTEPTGTVLVLAPDARATALQDSYDDLVEQLVSPDPQTVPDVILSRAQAVSPSWLLGLDLWPRLRRLRQTQAAHALPAVRSLLQDAGLVTAGAAR